MINNKRNTEKCARKDLNHFLKMMKASFYISRTINFFFSHKKLTIFLIALSGRIKKVMTG